MTIGFLDRQYEVIQKLKTTPSLDLYLVKDLSGPDRTLYTAACVRDSELIKKLIPITTKKNTSMSFKDLHDSFNAGGMYYIIFHYSGGSNLQQALQENTYQLRERLLIMKNIFSQLLLLNMTECFVYEVLRKDNIIVDESLGVSFNYFFTELDYYWQVDEKHCIQRLSALANELFRKEITEKRSAALTEFCRNLESGRYAFIWDSYEAFDNLYTKLVYESSEDSLKPKRIWWRAWEQLKKKMPVIRAFLAVLVIAAAGIYLLIHIPNPVLSENGITFSQIGTLDIQEDNP